MTFTCEQISSSALSFIGLFVLSRSRFSTVGIIEKMKLVKTKSELFIP